MYLENVKKIQNSERMSIKTTGQSSHTPRRKNFNNKKMITEHSKDISNLDIFNDQQGMMQKRAATTMNVRRKVRENKLDRSIVIISENQQFNKKF